MNTFLVIIQIVLAIALTILIFFQAGADDSKSNILSPPRTMRGWDLFLFRLTLVVLVLFILSSLIQTLT